MTVRHESKATALKEAAEEKVRKCKHLSEEVMELTDASTVNFMGFPMGARGQWFEGNYKLWAELGLWRSLRDRVVKRLSPRSLASSVDIAHTFASEGGPDKAGSGCGNKHQVPCPWCKTPLKSKGGAHRSG